jgi:hypothetical protein
MFMETIFDHSITESEQNVLFGSALDQERYRYTTDTETANADLYRLFSERGEPDRAETYLNRIKDPLYRFETSSSDIIS